LKKQRRNNPLAVIIAACAFLFLQGCARQARPYGAKEAVSALGEQSAKIQTMRGRAWLSAKIGENGGSFPALIAIDRQDLDKPKVRIEAIDPFGMTHALLILAPQKTGEKEPKPLLLTWIDYDQKKITQIQNSWNGIPLAHLPELLIGLGAIPKSGKVGGANIDGFDVRTPEKDLIHYAMNWIDPGPRLALRQVDGTWRGARFSVNYKKFLDKQDFYLPGEVEIKGQAGQGVELNLAWRERTWNESSTEKAFEVPLRGLEGFSRD